MSHPLVSIIIPVYNTEKYLIKCLDSIINQTYDNLEIIIINDCSPDNSDKIIESYKKLDHRILYIKNKENVGLGETRNIGITNASGKYIQFIDSDDFIELETVKILVEAVESTDADLVDFRYRYVSEVKVINEILVNQFFKIRNLIIRRDSQFFISVLRTLDDIVCNKLFKLEIITQNNIKFNFPIYEDTPFTLEYSFNSNKIIILENILYNYLARPSSITHSTSFEKYIDSFVRSNAFIFQIMYRYKLLNIIGKTYKNKIRNELAELVLKSSKEEVNYLYNAIMNKIYQEPDKNYYNFEVEKIKHIIQFPILKWLFILYYINKSKFIKQKIKLLLST